MKLSDILKQYRKENDLSQREFAKRCELSNSLISILEKGYNPQTGNPVDPDSRTYRRLADGMGITERRLREMLQQDNPAPSFASDANGSDYEIIEALHQNPNLRLLFDISRKRKPEDINKIIEVTNLMFGPSDNE